jgi:hypothetical protein
MTDIASAKLTKNDFLVLVASLVTLLIYMIF